MIDVLQQAALKGSDVLLKYFQHNVEIKEKNSHQSIVTVADTEAQQVIQNILKEELLRKGFPKDEIGFIGEENLHSQGKHMFVIDPLDGTSNFASGLDAFAISIAYFDEGTLTSSVIYRPVTHTLYTAELGKGAYKVVNGEKIKLLITPKNLKNSLFGTYMTSKKEIREMLIEAIVKLYPHFHSLRILGAATMDGIYLAENLFTVGIYGRTNIWDIAGVKLLVEEAGGNVYDWQGNALQLDLSNPAHQYQVLICHSSQKDQIVSILNE